MHDRLVDSLVGSIYAADTDRFSLAEVPQLAALANGNRSVLLAARRQRRSQAGTATAASSPIFATPRGGIGALVRATADTVVDAPAAASAPARAVTAIDRTVRRPLDALDARSAIGSGQAADDVTFDAVVFATPAAATASALDDRAPRAQRRCCARRETADVIMVTLHVRSDQWPDRLRGSSGYLVPKPDQRWVTAASFASQKWGHWRPPAGGEILRVSIGRDGMAVMHLDDDDVLRVVLDDLEHHLGIRFAPDEIRITRWPAAFAQYRPHHGAWVDAVEAALPSGRVRHRCRLPRHRHPGLCASGHLGRRSGGHDALGSGRIAVMGSPSDPEPARRRRIVAPLRRRLLDRRRRRSGRRRRPRRVRPTRSHRSTPTRPPRRPPPPAADHHDDHDHRPPPPRPPPPRPRPPPRWPRQMTQPIAPPTRPARRREQPACSGRIAIPKIGLDSELHDGIRLDHARSRSRSLAGYRACRARSATSSSPATAPATAPSSATSMRSPPATRWCSPPPTAPSRTT